MDHRRQAQQDFGEGVAADSLVGGEQSRTVAAIRARGGCAAIGNVPHAVEVLFAFTKIGKSESHVVAAMNPVHVVGELPRVIRGQKVFVVSHRRLIEKHTVVEDVQAHDAGVAAGGRARILKDRVKRVGGAVVEGDFRWAQGKQSAASYRKNELVGQIGGENVSFIDGHDMRFIAYVRSTQVRHQAASVVRNALVLGPRDKHAIFR